MIDLQVRSESGETVLRGSCGVTWTADLANLDASSFPCLTGLLPYADAMFNPRQASRLREEVADPHVREVIGVDAAQEIERLCLHVERGIALYLWFLGD